MSRLAVTKSVIKVGSRTVAALVIEKALDVDFLLSSEEVELAAQFCFLPVHRA